MKHVVMQCIYNLEHGGAQQVVVDLVRHLELGHDIIKIPVLPLVLGSASGTIMDRDGLAAERYDAAPGTCYLLRPDQHVAARFRAFDPGALRAARDRALGLAAAKITKPEVARR